MPKSIRGIVRAWTLGAMTIAVIAASALAHAQEAPSANNSPPAPNPGGDDKSFDELLSSPTDAKGTPSPGSSDSVEHSQPRVSAAAPSGTDGQRAPAVVDDTIPVTGSGENPKTSAKPRANGRQIEEIVVTATKREESIRDIPASVTAFTGADLESQGKTNLIDFIQETPGVTASQAAGGQDRITMRGINTDASPVSPLASPVGIFIGDVPFTDSYIVGITPDLSAFDLKDVEILKGPQGTLFGGAALSGAIRYQLQGPVLGEWGARGFSQYLDPTGGGKTFTSGAAVNLPVYTDKVAVRLAYVDKHLPGVTDDLYSGARDVDKGGGHQIRAMMLLQPIKDLNITITHLTQNFFAPNELVPSSPTEHTNNLTTTPDIVKNDFGMDAIEFGYDFYDMHFTSLSSRVVKHSYTHADEAFALVGPPPQGYPPELGAFSDGVSNDLSFNQELRLQSTGNGPLKWLGGIYYNRYKMHLSLALDTVLEQQISGSGSILSTVAGALGVSPAALNNLQLLNAISDAVSQERALFGDVTYTLWNRLDLGAGIRLYRTQLDGGFQGSGLLVTGENNGQSSDTDSTLKQAGVNPKFSITYHFESDASIYAAASKGYRFGGINDIPSTSTNNVPATYKSDTLWNYELGLRTDWFDRTLRADITLFDIQYKNPIIAQTTGGAFGLSYTDNVSAAVSRGIEPSLIWSTPIDGLRLSASGDLTDAHITVPFTASTGQVIPAGTKMPGAARYQYTSAIQYARPIWGIMTGVRTDYTHIGSGFTDIEHTAPCNGYGVLGAGLTVGDPGLPFHPSLAINVSNLLNVTKPTAAQHFTSIVTQEPVALYTLTPPRTISVRFSLDF